MADIVINIYSVLCARYLKYFISINLFDDHHNTVIKMLLLSPFCRTDNRGAEVLSHLPKITLLLRNRVEMGT